MKIRPGEPSKFSSALGRCLAKQGDQKKARLIFERTREWLFSGVDDTDKRRHELAGTAEIYQGWGETATAEEYKKALASLERNIREIPEAEKVFTAAAGS